jgi:hypothetical protein
MQEQHLFEYAVIRVVPKVEREEFLNVGVVVYCAEKKFLQALLELDEKRLKAFCGHCDVFEIQEYLRSFERICTGGPDSGPIGKLPVAERFRWLTATRSTVIQTSKVHSGLSAHVQEMLGRLYAQLVSME